MVSFILTLFHTGHKLRISTLYHLLTGKRTSSVLLHGFFYQNLPFFGCLPELKESTFKQVIDQLTKKQWISQDDGFGQLTSEGSNHLPLDKQAKLIDLKGLRYSRERQRMWQLTLLSVQVISYLSYHEKEYVPLDSRPFFLYQTKNWLRHSEGDILTEFPRELSQILAVLTEEQANFLANQFSGKEQLGKVPFQLLASEWQEMPWALLFYQNSLDAFIQQAQQQPNFRRLLSQFDQLNYNQSMIKTRQLYLTGYSVEKIGQARKLRPGTLNDHFIEWALLDPQFPFEQFELLEPASEEEMLAWSYQLFPDVPYLNFRLSQIFFLKELRV
ncbi:helix-turn-helix domain-containing protein [Enterococcus sp. 669A]|uniref:Helix-turn-helix domain-containing protein n=1 Tax=Candidatus Enterococcus moelleringii TaxID=2815325 RepID=A0ABS3LAU4_9ENTE|nr:helix-turn-helix domain-containing protein [Enterococcus sp. 669A]MBO1306758.1 helix-turn-helix domain-containing protein [Enterococcus sp. 669A]